MAKFSDTMLQAKAARQTARANGKAAVTKLIDALTSMQWADIKHHRGQITFGDVFLATITSSDGFIVVDSKQDPPRFYPPIDLGIDAAFDYVAELAGVALDEAEQAAEDEA